MTQTKYLREQEKGAKHVAFDPNGRYVAVSDINGKLYIYSLNEEEPELVRKLDGVIQALEPEKEATSKAVWHPDGTAFAVAEATRDISIYSISEWKKEKTFAGGHTGDITALSWSPNGTLLASAGADGQIVLWETKTQKILQHFELCQCHQHRVAPNQRTPCHSPTRMESCSFMTTLSPRTRRLSSPSPCRLLLSSPVP